MDHIGILGNTIEEIAADKCEIIKSGCKVVSAKQKPEVKKILEEKAERTGCPFTEAKPELLIIQKETYKGMDVETPDFGNLHSGLTGEYQFVRFEKKDTKYRKKLCKLVWQRQSGREDLPVCGRIHL